MLKDDSSCLSQPHWRLELDGFRARFEVVDGRVLVAESSGYLQAAHLVETAALRSLVIAETGGHHYPFYVMGVDDVTGGSIAARRGLIESFARFHRENPLEALILYGPNRSVRAAIALAKPFFPFQVMVTETREQALELTRATGGKRRSRRRQHPTQAHVDDLMLYLAGIEWDQDGLPETLESRRSHPFRPIFEAIRLVKSDLDQVLDEQRRAEAEVRRGQAQLDALIEHLPEGVALLDGKDRFLLLNPRAEALAPHFEVADDDNRLLKIGGRPVEELKRSATGEWGEIIIDDRERCELEIMFQDLETSGSLLVLRDVTREREVSRQLEQQERLAAVGQLASGIAHDFNNILQAILLNADPLGDSKDESAKHQYVSAIVEHSERGGRLIRQILDFSRRSVSSPEPIEFATLLREIIELLDRTIPATIDIKLTAEEEPLPIRADATQIQQLITNLALNARDAMPQGGMLHFELAQIKAVDGKPIHGAQLEPGDWVVLRVSDSGEGIAEEHLPKIFEPFFTTKGPGEGTGLGLAQVYGIVQQHGGRIVCESSAVEGTTFSIYLPRIDRAELNETTPSERPSLTGAGQRILVVEDNPTIRVLVARTLESLGYEVQRAADGVEALDTIEASADPISLVISDIVMPGMGGLELHEKVRKQYPDIQVLMMTAYPLGEVPEGLVTMQDRMIHKPFTMQQLAQSVAEILEEPADPETLAPATDEETLPAR